MKSPGDENEGGSTSRLLPPTPGRLRKKPISGKLDIYLKLLFRLFTRCFVRFLAFCVSYVVLLIHRLLVLVPFSAVSLLLSGLLSSVL